MKDDELELGEVHPSAHIARDYIAEHLALNPMTIEAIASTALSGSRIASICLSTYERMVSGKPVSDRYVMGLAWLLYSISNK